jgi:hypothetical protein
MICIFDNKCSLQQCYGGCQNLSGIIAPAQNFLTEVNRQIYRTADLCQLGFGPCIRFSSRLWKFEEEAVHLGKIAHGPADAG